MKTRPLVLTLLALAFALAPQSPRSAFAKRREDYSAKLISPRVGDVLRPGQVVKIEWTTVFPNVDLTMCETELLISIDGGMTYTFITSQRDPKVQYFSWTVPNTPTRAAILDIRFGCLNIYAETTSRQLQSVFAISAN